MKQSSPKYISGKPYQIRTSTFDNFKGLLDRITFLNLEQQYLIWGVGLILFSAIFFVGFMTAFFAQFIESSSVPFVAYFQKHPNYAFIFPLGLFALILSNYGRWFGYKFMKHN